MAADYQFHDADVISPEVYGRISHPHHAFAWLRANDPLRYVECEGFQPVLGGDQARRHHRS